MTPQETADLLRYCAGVDQWLKATSHDEAAVMVAGWADLLADVPADFAARVARSHYRQAEARTLQPGDVTGAWESHRRRQASRQAQDERRAEPVLVGPAQASIAVGSGAQYLRDMLTAIQEGRDPSTVSRPAGLQVLTAAAEERSRRCVFHDICACDHTRCREGFLDEPAEVTNSHGKVYEAVRRCGHCEDAMLMAEERGRARKPRAASRGRR